MRILLVLLLLLVLSIDVHAYNGEVEKLLDRAASYLEGNKPNKALFYIKKAERVTKQSANFSEQDLFPIFITYSSCYLELKDVEKSAINIEKANAILEVNPTMEIRDKADLWNEYAKLYTAKREWEQAGEFYLKYCDEVQEVYKGDEDIEALYLKNKIEVGTCHLRMGRIVRAIDIYECTLPLFPKKKYVRTKYITLSNLGYCYDELGEFEKAIEKWENCEILNRDNNLKLTLSTNNLGGLYYVTKKDFEKAEYYFKKVIKIIDGDKTADKGIYAYAAKNLCTIYFQNKEYDKAFWYINIALKSAMENYGPEFELTNEILSEKGRILMMRGEIVEAEKLFAKANKNLAIDPHDKSTYENIGYIPQLHNVLSHQSKAYMELYERTKDLSALKQGNFLSDINLTIINSARSSLSNADSKRGLMWSASAVFQVKIKILELLYKETSDKKYLSDAFELFEKTNNFILLEAVLKDEVANQLGLPQELLDQEINLKSKLAEAESTLYDVETKYSKDTTKIKAAEALVLKFKSNYHAFLDTLKVNYSNYFKLNYGEEVVDIDKLQNSFLKSDQTLIHYYMSEDEVHCIAINKNEVDFFHVPNTKSVIDNIETFRAGILKAHTDRNSATGLESLTTASHQLYNSLIKPIKIPLNEKLIVIPMGELSYIPFDVLLKSKPEKLSEFYDYQFLLRDHAISYGYSSTLLYDAAKRNHTNATIDFVGFAPEFNSTKIASNRSELVSLAHNESEVKSINEIIGGDVFVDEEASREKFVEVCKDYKILHLATHGVSNADKGENSYLAFSESLPGNENSLLYARDIYNLKLDADMVVLSACETAIGEIQLGEGIISLARAFTYAGARSSLTTLWQVNDEAASILMQNFYDELKQGIPKDEALRNAKEAYLEKSMNEFAHPFYWSAFIPVGDMSAIEIADKSIVAQFGFMGISGFLMLGVAGYLFFKRDRTLKFAA